MFGVLFFIDGVANVPHYLILFLIVMYTILFRHKRLSQGIAKNRQFGSLLIFFLLLCFINNAIHGFPGIPNMVLMPVAFLCAFAIDKNDAKIFAILVFLECFIGFYEYSLGIASIIPSENNSGEFVDDELLYFKRVSGICNNSSTYGQQLLYSILFTLGFEGLFTKKQRIILLITFLLGLYTTFNRTALGIAFLYLMIEVYLRFKYLFKLYKGRALILSFFFIGVLLLLSFVYGQQIISQFNRGGDSVDLTGRPYIWSNFLLFISEHLLGGNGSVHYMIQYHDGFMAHAHNSFIQMVADHGIPIALFYFFIIFSKLRKHNLKYCIVLFSTSLTQYILFWGFSMADVMLFAFLCNPNFYYSSISSTKNGSRKRQIECSKAMVAPVT